MLCAKICISWDRTEFKYRKTILLFTSNITCDFISKHIWRCTYDISQDNLIYTFYNILETYEQTKLNCRINELWESTNVYTYCFYSLISIFIITFFDVRNKLNNHIIQCFDTKCTYNIEPLETNCHILQSYSVLFSNCDRIFNHIWISITYYYKHMKSKNHILQGCNLKMHLQNWDIKVVKYIFLNTYLP